MERQRGLRRSGMMVVAFALLFLVTVSSSVLLFSDDEVSAADAEVDGINYTLFSSPYRATVIAIPAGYSGEVVIPQTVTSGGITYNVTSIGASAFLDNTGVTSVEIGSLVGTIGASAFSGCTGLTSVEFKGSSIATISSSTFQNCYSLTTIDLPDSVTSINTYAFSGCTNLEEITIPSQVTTIQYYAFSECTSLEEITIPSQVKTLQNHVFFGCTELTSVEFKGSLITAISSSTFQNCYSLTTINIPDSVKTMGNTVFSGCTSLEEITIPESVEAIDYNTFSGCTSLRSVLFEEGEEGPKLKILTQQVFSGCTSLESITIPSSVTEMKSSVFSGCTVLTSVQFEETASLGNIGNGAFTGTSLGSITIPKSVTSIDQNAFNGCATLTSVTFEDDSSLLTISTTSFTNCTGLESITIPKKVTTILGQAFSGCTSMTSLEFEGPSSLMTISSSAFSGCRGLTSISIPDSVTKIEGSAFSGCTGLTSVTIPNSVTTIGENVFSNCPIRTLTITPVVGKTTSAILGASFNWKLQGQNLEVLDLVIDASDLSIQTIEGKTVKRIIFKENATATTGGSFYDPDGPELMTGDERANKIYIYDTAAAKWFALKHTVTFEANSDIPVPEGRVFDGYKQVDPGTPVRYGYIFGGWFSDSNFDHVYDFSAPVTSDIILYAKWTPEFVNTISSSAEPGGSIDPLGPQEVPYDGITFSFKGDAGYRIKDVKVDGVSVSYDVGPDGTGTYSFRYVEDEHTISVEFEAYHAVSVNSPSNGSAEASDYAPVHGNSVTVTIRSNVGYTLGTLTDNGADVLASAVEVENGVWTYTLVSVASDHAIIVAFVKITYEMTVDHSGEGTMNPDSSFIVEYGDNVIFTFKAIEGHHISEVLADGVAVTYDTDADGTGRYSFLNIVSNRTFEVIFAINTYNVILVSGDGYTLVPAEGFSSPVDYKGSFAFVFSLNEGYDRSVPAILMNGEEIATVGSGPVKIILRNITEEIEITVSGITINVYTVTLTPDSGMTGFRYKIGDAAEWTAYSAPFTVTHGQKLETEALLKMGYHFVGWNGSEGDNPLTVASVSDDVTYSPTSAIDVCTVILPSGTGYAVTADAGSSSPVNYGGSFTFVFTLGASHSESIPVVKVNGTAVTLTSGKYTISNITADMTVTVEGVVINQYNVTLPSGTGYAVTADAGSSSPVDYGGSFTFVFTLDASHSESAPVVKVNGVAVTLTGGKYTISNITADMTVTVEGVVINTYTVTLPSGTGYAVTAVESSSPLDYGGSYTFMFALDASHSKSPAVVKVNGAAVTLTGGKYTISNITADTTVTVEGVVINQYDVTVTSDGEDTAFTYAVDGNDPVEFTAGPGGYDISVSHGSVLVIRVMPGEGHSFKWTDTGAGTVNGNVLTINVTGDNEVGGHLTEDSAAPYMLNIGILALAIPILLLFAIGRMRARP